MRRESSTFTADRFLRAFMFRTKLTPKQYEAKMKRKRSLAEQIEQWRAEQGAAYATRQARLAAQRDLDSESVASLVFREMVFKHVGYFPRRPCDIRNDVINDYGSHTERRFWRALRRLIFLGVVERTSDGYRRASSPRVGGPP